LFFVMMLLLGIDTMFAFYGNFRGEWVLLWFLGSDFIRKYQKFNRVCLLRSRIHIDLQKEQFIP
jgi:hypothetical protein